MATAIHTVKPENIATFLGLKLDPRYQGEIGNNCNVFRRRSKTVPLAGLKQCHPQGTVFR